MTIATERPDSVAQRDALGERLFAGLLGAVELLTVELGVRLGLYQVLRDSGPATPGELAARAGVEERYAREWLEQQAVAGVLDLAGEHRYALPAGHAEALLDAESPGYAAALPPGLLGMAKVLDELTAAYRTGAGVPYAHYGPEIRDCIAGVNRPMFVNDLAAEWLPALPDVHARIQDGGPVRVLDLACGTGWSSIALARSGPGVSVTGVDLDDASIAQARRNAADAGVADRVRFHPGDAAALRGTGGYDLACIFEALHDMGDPVGALAHTRMALADGAPLLVADERVAESFGAPGDEFERLCYGFSVLHCLPATRAESPNVAHGTMLRPDTMRRWAREAGFRRCAELPIANDFWRFYRLDG